MVAPARHHHSVGSRWAARAGARLGCRAVHLHSVLIVGPCAFLGYLPFITIGAAALLVDGRAVAAAQEERFTRRKHDARFPEAAVRYCLREAGLDLDDLDHVVFFEKPFIKFRAAAGNLSRQRTLGVHVVPGRHPVWIKEKLFQKSNLIRALKPFRVQVAISTPSYCSPSITRAMRHPPSFRRHSKRRWC